MRARKLLNTAAISGVPESATLVSAGVGNGARRCVLDGASEEEASDRTRAAKGLNRPALGAGDCPCEWVLADSPIGGCAPLSGSDPGPVGGMEVMGSWAPGETLIFIGLGGHRGHDRRRCRRKLAERTPDNETADAAPGSQRGWLSQRIECFAIVQPLRTSELGDCEESVSAPKNRLTAYCSRLFMLGNAIGIDT